MEFSSPLTLNSSKLSAITDFLFLLPTSQALYKGMFNIFINKRINKHPTCTYFVEMTDIKNGIRPAVSSWTSSSGIFKSDVPLTNVEQILGVHPGGLTCSFPKLNGVPTLGGKKVVKIAPFPACSRGSTPGKANDKCIMDRCLYYCSEVCLIVGLYDVR